MNERRWTVLGISPELLLEIVKDKTRLLQGDGTIVEISSNPVVPTDARLHHAYYDVQAGIFCAVVEHESFSHVLSGSQIPHVLTTCTLLKEGARHE